MSEALAPDGSELGVDGLCAIIADCQGFDSEHRLGKIVESMHQQERTIHDDVTLLMIETRTVRNSSSQ